MWLLGLSWVCFRPSLAGMSRRLPADVGVGLGDRFLGHVERCGVPGPTGEALRVAGYTVDVARDGEDGYRMRLPAYRPEPRPLAKIAAAVGGSPPANTPAGKPAVLPPPKRRGR